VDADALAGLTPVALNLGPAAPTLDWGDLADASFAAPFFDQTVERWAAGPAPRLLRTGLGALAALDHRAARDPDVIVFHLSRCGSTLVSRLLALVPGARVIAEPMPLNALLTAEASDLGDTDRVELLRLLVRALGRAPTGAPSLFALKTSSWNVASLPLFRRAFPAARTIFVHREPGEVVASLLADPPGWMRFRADPRRAARLFGVAASEFAGLEAGRFCARGLAAMLETVGRHREDILLIDYRDLPDAVWSQLAPHLGLSLAPDDIARMREEARFSAKSAERRLFVADAATKRAAAAPLAPLVAPLEPLYGALTGGK
jgi:hypothetical protein